MLNQSKYAFEELMATWNDIVSPLDKFPLDINDLGPYIEAHIKPSVINTHAVTVVDLRTNNYLYVDSRIEQVTGYTKAEYEKNGPRFMFSKIPLRHKIGVINSTLHQNRYVANLDKNGIKDLVINREINVIDKNKRSRRILHQVLDHLVDPSKKIQAVISLQTQIGHISSATKFKYYIYSKRQNAIVHPIPTKITFDLFTQRENEIISLISEGHSSAQIAEQLYLSLHTVKTHRKNILKKSNASNFFELLHSLKN